MDIPTPWMDITTPQTYPPTQRDPVPRIPPLPHGQTDTYENITLPPLHMRAVIKETLQTIEY